MADEELTLDPDLADVAAGSGETAVSASASAAESSNGPPSGEAFGLDEQTLGRSSSVFDAGVDLLAPAVPPPVGPPPGALGPGAMGPAMAGYPAEPELAATPMSQRERRRRVRLEARRVRRIVRHIEPWSVFKISVLFYMCLWLIFLLAGVMLWSFAESSGTLEGIEDLIEDLFTLEEENEFFSGSTIFRAYAIASLVISLAGVAFNVLLCVLYNRISDLTGGMRITVIEEESARFQPPRRRRGR